MTDHDKLRRIAENATPGPWQNDQRRGVVETDYTTSVIGAEDIAYDMCDADADFIAAANPTTVLALLDELAAVAAERDAYRRGQGPAPTPATPGTVALHETHPIPNSRGDDQ